jgi:hypothetical protein
MTPHVSLQSSCAPTWRHQNCGWVERDLRIGSKVLAIHADATAASANGRSSTCKALRVAVAPAQDAKASRIGNRQGQLGVGDKVHGRKQYGVPDPGNSVR